MNTFAFGGISVSSSKKSLNLKNVQDIVLADFLDRDIKSRPVVVLTDEFYNKIQLNAIKLFLESQGLIRYKIVYSLRVIANSDLIKEEQKSGPIDFYRKNSSDFWKELPDGCTVITSGPALYAIAKGGDVYPSYTIQRIFGVSNFWVSPNQSENGVWVYPIESFNDIFAYGFSAKPVDSYITKLAQFQINDARMRRSVKAPPSKPLIKHFLTSSEEFDEFYENNKHRNGEILCYDLETSGFNPHTDHIGCITMSFDGVEGWYIPWRFVDPNKLNIILKNNKQLGANLKFDIKFLWKNGVPDARVDLDTFVLGHMLDETRSNSLKTHAYLYTRFGGYEDDLDEYKRKVNVENYLDIPEDILKEYAIMDAIVCWQVFDRMYDHAKLLNQKYRNDEKTFGWDLIKYFHDLRIPAVNCYAGMEYEGAYVNKEQMDKLRILVTARIEELQDQLRSLFHVGKTFDFGSTEALGTLLEENNWSCLGRNKKGIYTTGDEQLALWALEHEEAKVIQEFRSTRVILNTFIGDIKGSKGWSQYLTYHPEDGSYRMHSNYGAMATESGRTRSSEPNLQNVPTHGIFAKEIKECLCTPNDDEYFMLTADGSGLQMRLATADGMDPVLMKEYASNIKADVHSSTAYGIFLKGRTFLEVEQDGKTYYFQDSQEIQVQRDSRLITIQAGDLEESDTIVFDH